MQRRKAVAALSPLPSSAALFPSLSLFGGRLPCFLPFFFSASPVCGLHHACYSCLLLCFRILRCVALTPRCVILFYCCCCGLSFFFFYKICFHCNFCTSVVEVDTHLFTQAQHYPNSGKRRCGASGEHLLHSLIILCLRVCMCFKAEAQ